MLYIRSALGFIAGEPEAYFEVEWASIQDLVSLEMSPICWSPFWSFYFKGCLAVQKEEPVYGSDKKYLGSRVVAVSRCLRSVQTFKDDCCLARNEAEACARSAAGASHG